MQRNQPVPSQPSPKISPVTLIKSKMFPKEYVNLQTLPKELVYLKHVISTLAAVDIDDPNELTVKKLLEPLTAN